MDIPKEFYRLSDLAKKRWKLKEDDILNLAFGGKFFISVFWDGPYCEGEAGIGAIFGVLGPIGMKATNFLKDFVHLDPKDIRYFLVPRLHDEEGVQVSLAYKRDGEKITLTLAPHSPFAQHGNLPFSAYHTKKAKEEGRNAGFPTFSRSELVILTEEVKKYEDANPHIIKAYQADEELENGDLVEVVLNPNHPWHSEPLAIAVKAWLAEYADRDGNKYDNNYRVHGGNGKLIREWLRKNYPTEAAKPETTKHYCYIVNPSKQGGPGKTSK